MAGITKIRKFNLITTDSKSTKNKEILTVFMAVLGLANLFFSIIPTMFFVFMILIVQFYTLNKFESAFIFSLYASTIGIFFAIKGINGVGSVLLLIAFIIFALDYKVLFGKYIMATIPLFNIFVLLLMSVLFTKGGDYANEKLINTIISGILTSFAFAHFLYYNFKYRPFLISIFTLIYALFTLYYSIEYYGFSIPKNLLELGYMRNMISEIQLKDFDVSINYQSLGYMGVLSLSFLFFARKFKITKFDNILVFSLSIIVVLYSGARQAILAIIIIISLNLLRNRKKINLIKYIYLLSFISLIYFGIQRLDVWFISDLRNSGSLIENTGRNDLIDVGLDQFLRNPFTGVGYGRYINPDNNFGGSPHNILVELLAEIGILGFSAILLILIAFLSKNFRCFKNQSNDYFAIYCILITYCIRSLVSADMSYNIELFAILFMLPLFRPNKKMIYKI